ncbi:hypothetical protein [Nocardia asteroides]|uniref:hypothetical protein n=1 Tax=Nocardia asteroides TaxID=1824 RepID=UPI001E5B74FC|nr:hypothetical protein [Nocardia asteroides]UGT63310.1 hypothetical protein LTT61_08375 [Nocardia asteroides]
MPTYQPLSPGELVARIAERVLSRAERTVVAVDGADAADPESLAAALVSRLRDAGRDAAPVPLHGYVRPASLRLEYGRDDTDSYRYSWFDYAALDREVLRALRERGRWLPALWDEAADRSARAALRSASDGTVLVVAGPMLLGRGFTFDATVRLELSEPALRRRTPDDQRWTVPALLAHAEEYPEEPDFAVRWDHPSRPALRISA